MPGIQLPAQRIRLAVDASNPDGQQLINVINGGVAKLPSGAALQFELLFYFQNLLDASLLDLSIYSQIVIALQDNTDPHNSAIFYQGAVALANFNQAATVENWNANAVNSAQVTLVIPSAQNVVPPGNTTYWLCIYGVSNDGMNNYVPLMTVAINGKDSGLPQGAPVLSQPLKVGPKLSFVCGDGQTRDLTINNGPGGSWTIYINQAGYNGPGQASFSFLCKDGFFRDLSLQLQDGQWVEAINQNGHA